MVADTRYRCSHTVCAVRRQKTQTRSPLYAHEHSQSWRFVHPLGHQLSYLLGGWIKLKLVSRLMLAESASCLQSTLPSIGSHPGHASTVAQGPAEKEKTSTTLPTLSAHHKPSTLPHVDKMADKLDDMKDEDDDDDDMVCTRGIPPPHPHTHVSTTIIFLPRAVHYTVPRVLFYALTLPILQCTGGIS